MYIFFFSLHGETILEYGHLGPKHFQEYLTFPCLGMGGWENIYLWHRLAKGGVERAGFVRFTGIVHGYEYEYEMIRYEKQLVSECFGLESDNRTTLFVNFSPLLSLTLYPLHPWRELGR